MSSRAFIFAALIGIATLIFCFSSFSFVRNYHKLSKEGAIKYRPLSETESRNFGMASTFMKETASSTNIGLIRNWMTFDYINRLFNIPPSYFETKLNVTSTNYPRITIKSVAKQNNADQSDFILHIQNLVREYLLLIH